MPWFYVADYICSVNFFFPPLPSCFLISLSSSLPLTLPFCLDRSGIENVNSVEALQETLIRALRTLIMKNHPNEASIFTKLLLKLPDLRSLNNMHSEELLAFKVHP